MNLLRRILLPVVLGALLGLVIIDLYPRLRAPVAPVVNQVEIKQVAAEAADKSPTPAKLPAGKKTGPVSYADAVKKAQPAVVNVFSDKIVTRQWHPIMDDPFLQRFFGLRGQPLQQRIQSSLGSGVIVSENGYILTNNHVIADADVIRVALQDGRDFDAQLVGTDVDTDLAVLHIDAKGLSAITLGNSDQASVGDVVLAIGNPYGVGQTVTMGIISATGRNLSNSAFEDFIQTDAPINPGNSGGALVDALGNLIGINTLIYSKSGGSQGIGFAIPIHIAREVMLEILKNGYVVRGWIGVDTQALTPDLAARIGIDYVEGQIITGLFRDGPAHRAGLLPGDVLVGINDQPTTDGKEIVNTVAKTKPGDVIHLVVNRGGKNYKVDVISGRRPN
ncbi:MAG TPA: trypsin-like peptidase domain-containing protein [Pseudomonadales bacterium]|nr:trypsin-like peptidase domain-containing protein [Pseudomonadales bacterium]